MAGERYVVESSSTRDAGAPRERADFWTERIVVYHNSRLGFRFPHTEDFHGETVRQYTGAYQLIGFRSDQIAYTRTARQVRQDPNEDYRLVVPLAGELVVRQDGEQARVAAGAAGVVTYTAPFEVMHDASLRALVMTIPAREINGPLNRTAPLAAALDLTVGLGRVVHGMLISLHEQRDALTGVEFDAVCGRIVELLCLLAVGDDRPRAPGHLAEVEALVRSYVRGHAADPGLCGEAVARALGWSLRQVQLALQRVGTTPRELIREERLRMVRDRLTSPAHAHLSITDLAYAAGFSSASALSSTFRKRYGMSPREMRHAGTTQR